jgi:hypothetical protein
MWGTSFTFALTQTGLLTVTFAKEMVFLFCFFYLAFFTYAILPGITFTA